MLVGVGAVALGGLDPISYLVGGKDGGDQRPETRDDSPPQEAPRTTPYAQPEPTPEPTEDGARAASVAVAVEDYFRAVDREDWSYTYARLDSETKALFTEEEWSLKNQWFADNGSVIYHVESVERLGTSSGVVVEVSLRLTYGDGSSSPRTTYFVLEGGEWKHAFGQEEYDLFMLEASYEEFVAAQQ